MKTNMLKLTAIMLLLMESLVSCEKGTIIRDTVAYAIGYNVQSGTQIEDNTGKASMYLLVSENLKDTLATCNLPDSLFIFPSEIFMQNVCGFDFFPQEYRFAYKIQMKYRLMTKEERLEASFICPANLPQQYNVNAKYIFITSIYKIQ